MKDNTKERRLPLSGIPEGVSLVVVLFLITVILKHDTLNQPYHWDAMGYVIYTAQDMLDHGFRLIHPWDTAHPPLFFMLLAVLWNFFGTSLYVAHLLIIFFGVIGLIYTYKLGRLVCNEYVGLGAAILLFFNQIFAAQIGTIELSMPLLYLGVASTYHYIKKEKARFVFISSVMLLVKETALMFIVAFVAHSLIVEYKKGGKERFIRNVFDSSYLLIPVIPLALWFLYHWTATGWVVHTEWMFNKPVFVGVFILNVIRHFFADYTSDNVNRFNGVVSLGIVFYLVLHQKKKTFWGDATVLLFILIIFFHVALFSYSDDLPRYFLATLPFFYILGCGAIFSILPDEKTKIAIFFTIIFFMSIVFTTNYRGERNAAGWQLESNLEYLDLIETHKDAAKYIETNFQNYTVVTCGPMTSELGERRNGYVSKEINVSQDYDLSADDVILYYSPQSDCWWIIDSLDKERLVLVERFEKNGKYTEIYRYSR